MTADHPVTLVAATVAPLASSVVVSILLEWTIVLVEASRPLPVVLPTYASKMILLVTTLSSFPVGRTLSFFYTWYYSNHIFHLLTLNQTATSPAPTMVSLTIGTSFHIGYCLLCFYSLCLLE